jgi:hypothetical protein
MFHDRPLRQLLCDHFEGPADFAQQVREFRRPKGLFGIDDHVGGYRLNRTAEPNRLSQAPLHPIAIDRSAKNAADGEPNSKPLTLRSCQVKHGHVGGKVATSLLVHSLKIRVPQKATATGIFSARFRARRVPALRSLRTRLHTLNPLKASPLAPADGPSNNTISLRDQGGLFAKSRLY